MGEENLQPDNIVNMDGTNFYFDSPCKETLALKGSSTVPIKTSGSSARCTVILAVTQKRNLNLLLSLKENQVQLLKRNQARRCFLCSSGKGMELSAHDGLMD